MPSIQVVFPTDSLLPQLRRSTLDRRVSRSIGEESVQLSTRPPSDAAQIEGGAEGCGNIGRGRRDTVVESDQRGTRRNASRSLVKSMPPIAGGEDGAPPRRKNNFSYEVGQEIDIEVKSQLRHEPPHSSKRCGNYIQKEAQVFLNTGNR